MLVLAICLLSNLLAGLTSTLMSAYLPDAVRELAGSTDAATVGRVGAWIGGLFLVGWAVGGVGLGWAADRFGRARTFTLSVLIFAIATVAAGRAGSWEALVACRFATGMGIGGTMVASAILVAEAWGARARAIALGFLGVSYPIGIISTGLISYSVANWRDGFLIGLAPLALGLLASAVVRDSERWLTERDRRTRSPAFGSFSALLTPAHRADFILGATVFGTMSVGIWATFSWLPAWAADLIGTTSGGLRQRGLLMMVLGMGGIVGGAFSGFLANELGRRRTLMIAFAGAFTASMVLFSTNDAFSPLVYLETAFLAVFFGISQGALTIYIPELFPTGLRATATGVCFNVGRIATAAAVFSVGVLVPMLGGYASAILVFSTIYLAGLIATLLGHETRGLNFDQT